MAFNTNNAEPESDLEEQALGWFVRLRSGEATVLDRRRFEQWLAADIDNAREFDRLKGLWRDLDELPEEKRAEWRNSLHRARHGRGLSRRQLLTGGAAAAIGVTGAVALFSLTDLTGLWQSDFRTGTGGRKTVRLADGSVVDMDADTAISIDYASVWRCIRLLYGRAAFAVARDARRPFEVACANGITRAAGTEFLVHRCADQVIVTITESAVEVAATAARGGQSEQIRAVAGETVSYGRDGLDPVEKTHAADETGWQRGKLIFTNRRLADVVSDLNRYRSGRIVLLDDSLAELRVDGVFETDHPDAALDAITRTLPVRPLQLTRYLVLLHHA